MRRLSMAMDGVAPALRGSAMAIAGMCLAAILGAGCGDDAQARDDAGGAGSGGDGGGNPPEDAGDGPSADCRDPVPAFDDVEIFARCTTCHSIELEGDARNDATDGVNFDDYDSASAAAERAALYVFHGIMPPPRSGITVTEREKQQLYQWALCGTPE